VAVEVINTGLSGIRARHNYATLKRISSLHPDIVLFLLGINDWNRQIRDENATYWERIAMFYVAPLRLRDTLLGRTIQSVRFRLKNMQAIDDGKSRIVEREFGEHIAPLRGSLQRSIVLDYVPTEILPEYTEYLVRISQFCKDHSFDCVFITQPTGYERNAEKGFRDGFWMTPPRQKYTLTLESMETIANMYNRYLVEFARANNHLICDLAADFEPSYEFFYDDCHFNENGAQRAAESLEACLAPLFGDEGAQEKH
jgi:lysophospholipase L1-like esterase